MLKIKLSRIGRKNAAYYRVIVAEARSKNNGKVIDSLGHYDPADPKNTLLIDQKRYADWLKKGAQPTNTVRLLFAKQS